MAKVLIDVDFRHVPDRVVGTTQLSGDDCFVVGAREPGNLAHIKPNADSDMREERQQRVRGFGALCPSHLCGGDMLARRATTATMACPSLGLAELTHDAKANRMRAK